MKTYTGGQGYVYQYYFVGKRASLANAAEASTEFIFDVTSDRKNMFAVSVFLPRAAVEEWAAHHGRQLTDAEEYGAVKMRLFQAFDEIEDLQAEGRRLNLDSADLVRVLSLLGID